LALLEQARNAAREAGRATAVRDVEHLMVFSVAQTGALDDAAKLAARLRAEAEPGTFEALYARLAECLLLARHDVPLAAQSLEQTLSEEVRAVHGLGQMLADLAVGTIRTAQGRYDEAAAAFERALDSSIRSGARRFWVSQVCSALPLLVARNQPEARVLWAAVLASGRPPILLETVGLDAAVAQLGQVEPRAVPAPAALELARRAMRSDGAAAEPQTLRPPSAGATSTAPTTRNASQPHLRQVGAMWSVLFDGNTVHLPDMKGLHDLATLLRQPGREVHVLDLAAAVPAGVVPAQRRDDAGVDGQPGDLGDIVDEQARSAYKRRLTELEEELAEADRLGDAVRAASYAAERDALIAQLSQAYGLSGRVRRAGDPVERARSAVGWRVRTALKKIREADPKLGRHLQHSVHTGVWCSYRPDEPVDWEVTTA
jgi:tetratricopeptide (TPR) repeat protein